MSDSTNKVCRFCLCKILRNEFELVEEITREIVDELLFKMNLNITKAPVICKNCAVNLKRAFNFKSICLEIEDELFPFITENEKDLRKIYIKLKSTKDEQLKILPEQVVCRLCLSPTSASSVWHYPNKNPELVDILQKYFSAVALDHFEQTMICSFCVCLLNNFSKILNTIQDTERIIEKYIKTYGTDDLGQVDLSAVQRESCNIIKQEQDTDSESGVENNETTGNVEMTKIEKSLTKDEIHVKEEGGAKILEPSKRRRLRGKYKKKPPKPPKIYHCELCGYKTNINQRLERHSNVHVPNWEKRYQCDKCDFRTQHERYLQKHSLQHIDRSERHFFKCESCPFKTLQNSLYNTHVAYHANPSSVKIYKCEKCEFESIYKNSLEKHINKHKDKSEVKFLKCLDCGYETRYKQVLASHIALHGEPKPRLYKCETCDYKGRTQGEVDKHARTHIPKSEVKMYQCPVCSYEAREMYEVKRHMVCHKSESEVTMFECDKCTYRSRFKGYVTAHRKRHDKSSV